MSEIQSENQTNQNESEKIHTDNTKLSHNLLVLASTLLFFIFSLLSTSLITIFLKGQLSALQSVISLILALIFTVVSYKFVFKTWNFAKIGQIFGIAMVIFSICMIFGGRIIDLSYDGQGYHAAGKIAIDKGWNPFTEKIRDRKDIKSENKLWIQSYPHAANILALDVFKVTGNAESGKGFNLLWVIISGILGYLALLQFKNLNNLQRPILVALALLSPHNILQIYTFGLDTQFYSMFIVLLSLLVLVYKKFQLPLTLFNLGLLVIFLINNKLTSVAYLAIFTSFFCLYLLFEKKFKLFLQTAGVIIFATILAFGLFGYQPFITNYRNHKNPFYPVYVSKETNDKAYDFTENRPSNYLEENQVSLLFKSIFFKTNGNFREPEDRAEFKIPFTMTTVERDFYTYLGPKVGGFGPFFSGIFLLCVAMLGMLFFSKKRDGLSRKHVINFVLVIIAVIFSSALNPLNSAARYIPQFWFIIPLIVWLSWQYKNKILTALGAIAIIFVLVNSVVIFAKTSSFNATKTASLDKYLKKLADVSKQSPVLVNFAQAEGNEFLLNKYQVKFVADEGESSKFKCKDDKEVRSLLNFIGNSSAKVCLSKEEQQKLK
jgi:hypothetical protein